MLLRGGIVLCEDQLRDGCDVSVRGERIHCIGAERDSSRPAVDDTGLTIDVAGLLLVPGFIDLHLHGVHGAMCEDADEADLRSICDALPQYGVSAFLPTLATLPPDRLRACVEAIAAAAEGPSGARILGIHLEGPCLNRRCAGAQPVQWMRVPSLAELDDLIECSHGQIRLITVAPEIDGALDFIAAARARGIAVSLGHSEARTAEARDGVAAGARHTTHLFNGMRPLHHREPGIVGVALMADELSVELIADGHHVHPDAIDLAFRCKPKGKVVLVSDAVAALGMADGGYEMFGVPCVVGGGAVRCRDSGNLAGSCSGLDQAVRNVHAWLPQLGLPRVLQAASAAAADVLGLQHVGRLTVGAAADIAVLDDKLAVVATFVGGKLQWRNDTFMQRFSTDGL